jgi:hypothetical protein
MTKAQLMRASIDDWQTRDAYRQQQSFDNTFRRSMDNANSQRRNTMGYPNEELRSPQPNNQNKQSPPLAERPNSREDIPIMADMNRPLSPTVNINTGEPLSPSISPSIKSSHELYNEPETYPEHRASLPPIHPPTNLLRREGTPIYVADRFSRSEANIYNRMDPHSPVPIRKSMDNHQRLLNQELPSESPISKPSPENSLKLDSTPITKNTDGWQAQQGVISSQPRSKTLPTLEKMAEPTSTDDHQEQTFSDTNGDHPKSSTLGNNAASAFKKVDPASKPRDVDTWKPLPSVKPLDEENVSEMESHRISKKNTPPPIPKPRKNLDTKPEEKILIPTQPPAIPARHDIIIANHISGKNSPPPIPKPRQDHQKKEEKILIASQPPPIPFRRDISPNKVSQTTEREEPNMYNKIDTVKRPVRRNIQEAPGSVKEIQHNEEEALLDKQVKKVR